MRHSSAEHGPQQPQDYGVAEPCCVLRAAQDTAGSDALRLEYHIKCVWKVVNEDLGYEPHHANTLPSDANPVQTQDVSIPQTRR